MNKKQILILPNEYAFKKVPRGKLLLAHFVGYWSDDKFVVTKDRYLGAVGSKLHPDSLVEYITKYF